MTDKQLRQLNRAELLKLLLESRETCEQLEAELAAVRQRLEDRELAVQESGSMAEAALRINGVFEAANAAAEQYLDGIRRRQQAQEAYCSRLEAETRQKTDRMLTETRERCQALEQQASQRCEEMRRMAEQDANLRWEELFRQMELLRRENTQLRDLLESKGKKKLWGR